MGGTCSTHGRGEIPIHKIAVGKPEGKKLLARPKLRWEGNI